MEQPPQDPSMRSSGAFPLTGPPTQAGVFFVCPNLSLAVSSFDATGLLLSSVSKIQTEAPLFGGTVVIWIILSKFAALTFLICGT